MKDGNSGSAALIGWQTLLADLALILFMVTAAAMASSSRPSKPAPAILPRSPVASEPLAVWRTGGSLTLEQWLVMEQPDSRQQLTITARYRPGEATSALAAVQALVGQAGAIGQTARIIVVPAAHDETLASLAYDRAADAGTAQGLLNGPGIPPARTSP